MQPAKYSNFAHPPTIKTVTIIFQDDTPVYLHHVGREHIGRIQMRPQPGKDKQNPLLVGPMEAYFPAGTQITLPDYVASGVATIVDPPAPIQQAQSTSQTVQETQPEPTQTISDSAPVTN